MAVLPACPGLKVEIMVGETALKEYDDDADEKTPNTVSKYVEATTGSEFYIKWYFDQPFATRHGVKVEISLDGQRISGATLRKRALRDPEGHKCLGAHSTVDGRWYKQNLQFSELGRVEDSSSIMDKALKETLKSMGEILVEFHLVKDIKVRKAPPSRERFIKQPDLNAVPEKALSVNAISHGTSFATPTQSNGTGSVCCRYVGNPLHPFAKFRFKYRSLTSLKQMWIIRSEPSPIPRVPNLAATPTAVPTQEKPTTDTRSLKAMSRGELIALAMYHRSATEAGFLEALSHGELLALVIYHRKKDENEPASPKIKQELKREHVDDDEISFVETRSAKHRRLLPTDKDDVIELD